jgi:outer membrane protein
MRKVNMAACAAVLLGVSSAASAEIAGFEIGIAGWQASPSGWVQDEGTTGADRVDLEDDLQLGDETSGFAWIRLMHPIPVLPNIKLTYTPLQFEGSGTVDREFTFGNVTFTGSEQVDSEAELDQWDVTLFYEVLDNVVDLDLGINVKVLDGHFKATRRTTGETDEVDFTAPIPMLYANVGVNIPGTGIGLAVEASGIGYSGNSLSDIKASIGYTFAGVVGVEAGYRRLQMKIDDIEDVSADITIDGPYLGVAAKF